jgi:hypothetical protein
MRQLLHNRGSTEDSTALTRRHDYYSKQKLTDLYDIVRVFLFLTYNKRIYLSLTETMCLFILDANEGRMSTWTVIVQIFPKKKEL